MAQIFISYSRADRQFIEQFIPLIRRVYGNDSVWFDDDIHGGLAWWQMILNEIGKCDLFIYLVSNESLESPYCQAELREALRLKKQILPVVVRRLKPPYPGEIDSDLAEYLRRTQYVDMSSGFRDATTISQLYAALTQLLNSVPTQPSAPITTLPTPEPPVPDKKKPDVTMRAAYVGGGFLLISVVIAGIFGLWQGVFANNNQNTPAPQPTTAIAMENTLTPLEIAGATQTQVAADFQRTLDASGLTEAANERLTATAFAPTQESQRNATVNAILTATQNAVFAQQTANAPTPAPTLSPEDIAFTRQTSNSAWEPYLKERDFNGVTMVLVPAGCFMMGSSDEQIDYAVNELGGNRDNMESEQPVHEICFDEPFWIDKYEVTNEDYGSVGCVSGSSDSNQPRNCVTWFEANDHCETRSARLPTEAEWEYAARGPDSLVYPWGDEWDPDNANWWGTSPDVAFAVGSFPVGASWVGALDFSGNLEEWTSSLYEDYPYDEADGRERDTGDSTDVFRVTRGGSLEYAEFALRSALRGWQTPDEGYGIMGFRCARSY